MGADQLKLVQPTDFEILAVLEEHGRNVAPNIAAHLDRDKNYINTRLPPLADFGLIERVGPAENTGLYQITPKGERALEQQDEYGETDDFESLLENPLSN